MIFFTIRKAGRSGRFGDVMVMSHGRGLNILDTHRSLPTLGMQSAFSSFARAHSLTSIRGRYQRLVRSSQVWKLEPRESRTGDTGLKTRVNWCMQRTGWIGVAATVTLSGSMPGWIILASNSDREHLSESHGRKQS